MQLTTLADKAKHYPQHLWILAKSKVVLVMLLCSYTGMLISPGIGQQQSRALYGLLGIGLHAIASAAYNQWYEQSIDSHMQRTKHRPLATGSISNQEALIFCALTYVLGCIILWYGTNSLATMLSSITALGYGIIYTQWLKPSTPQNIVIGGITGAMPPLLGWSCIQPSIDHEPLLLVLLVFVWTPAHFWPLAIHNKNDYAHTKIPMLPNTHGIAFTKTSILGYSYLTSVVSLLPFCTHMSSEIYLICAIIINLRWLGHAHHFMHHTTHAMPFFKFSILYIISIFSILVLDHNIMQHYHGPLFI